MATFFAIFNGLTLMPFFFKILFMRERERERERERKQRHRQRKKQAPWPDAELDPETPRSCPGPKASAKP